MPDVSQAGFLQPFLEPLFGYWLYEDSSLWTITGFLGAAIFGSRFVLQWLRSEKEKKLVIPWYFWHLSFWGSVLNLLYFLHIDKAPLVLGNCFLPFLYGRNLIFLRREGTKGGGRKVFAAIMALLLGGFVVSLFFRSDGSGQQPVAANPAAAGVEMQHLREALEAYAATFAQLPSGDGRAILAALRGSNPQHQTFLQDASGSFNAEGDWLDPWGHPYLISTSAGRSFLIASAGEDGRFEPGPPTDDLFLAGTLAVGGRR